MFHVVALIQIAVYLFVMPVIGIVIDAESPHGAASLGIATLFILAYLAGHGSSRRRSPKQPSTHRLHAFTSFGSAAIVAWCAVHITLCLQYGLYDRRIGTDSIALLFAGLSLYELFAIRALEVFFPYLLAIAYFAYRRSGRGRDLLPLVALVGAFLASGAINSRSQAAMLGMSALIILQNALGPGGLRRALKGLAAIAILAVTLVSISRIDQAEDVDARNYARDEVVKRLDGLEVTSQLVRSHGVAVLGMDAETLLAPLVSAIPLFDKSTELKELALTTVKANILQNEFSSDERDINSFVVTDAYYTAGLVGIVVVGLLLGRATRTIDRWIGATRSEAAHLLMVAAVCNAIALEREAVSILIGTFRDWILLVGLMAVMCRWQVVPPPQSGPRPAPIRRSVPRPQTPLAAG